MDKLSRLTPAQRSDLVAYLDGELDDQSTSEIESVLAHSTAQSVFISVFAILPSFVLSGVMMPYELMPDGVRQLGGMLPLRWYQIALRAIIARGAGLLDVLLPLGALVGLLATILAVASWRLPRRLG